MCLVRSGAQLIGSWDTQQILHNLSHQSIVWLGGMRDLTTRAKREGQCIDSEAEVFATGRAGEGLQHRMKFLQAKTLVSPSF